MNQQILKHFAINVFCSLLAFNISAQCPVMEGAMINSCGVNEGPNEFIIFTTARPNPVSAYNFYYSISNQPSSNPTKTLAGASASVKSGTGIINSLCCKIKNITSPAAFIPANSKVIFIPSDFDWQYNISSLCSGDTIYVAFINTSTTPTNWSVAGNLGNYPNTRYLQVVDVINNCESTPRSYDQSIWPANLDGNAVLWNNAGDPTGFNNGCDFGPSGPTIGFTNPTVCLGTTSVTIPFTINGCPDKYSITWNASSLSAGFSNVINTPIPSSSSFNFNIPSIAAAGTYSADVTIQNSLSNVSGTFPMTITITPRPNIIMPVNKIVCNGVLISSTNFMSSSSGVIYSWTNDNTSIGLSASGNGSVPAFTAINNGTLPQIATINVTAEVNGCSGTPNSYTIIVNPNTNAVFTQLPSVCAGKNFTLPSTSDNGVTGKWTPAINNLVTTTYTFTPDTTMGNCISPTTMTVEIHEISADAGKDDIVTAYVPYQLQGSGGAANLQYSWVPSSALNNPYIPNPIAVMQSDTKFYLTVSDGSGCVGYDSVMIRVYRDSGFYVPNAFTPNGDGLNDVIKVIPVSISKIDYFRIFNRYGNMVFETTDISKGWDGYYKNKKQDTGTYIFIVKGTSITGTPVISKGSVLLIN